MRKLVNLLVQHVYGKDVEQANNELVCLLVSRKLVEGLEDDWSMPIQIKFAREPYKPDHWILLAQRMSLKTYQRMFGQEIVNQAMRQ